LARQVNWLGSFPRAHSKGLTDKRLMPEIAPPESFGTLLASNSSATAVAVEQRQYETKAVTALASQAPARAEPLQVGGPLCC
jgi:hypothetical protein